MIAAIPAEKNMQSLLFEDAGTDLFLEIIMTTSVTKKNERSDPVIFVTRGSVHAIPDRKSGSGLNLLRQEM